MKIYMFRFSVVLAFLGLILHSVPAYAAGTVDNFYIEQYKIDYFLSQDSEGRSTLKTIETVTAQFPNFDQNHGIERAIPSSYDGHPTDLKIASVVDQNKTPLHYTTYDSNNHTVVRIGEADTYVRGKQTYTITYTQRDVTRYFKDANVDEFYWDTVGTEWRVPIQALHVSVHFDPKVQDKMTGEHACYRGKEGDSSPCSAILKDGVLTTSATRLLPGENVTLASAFTPHAFQPYEEPLWSKLLGVWLIVFVATLPIGLICMIWVLVRQYRQTYRLAEIGTIVPEYLPPKDTSVSTAASIALRTGSVFSAQLIDLAVRHYIKIYQTREKSFFRQANYELEIVKDISGLKAEEQEIIKDIFSSTSVGSRLDMATLKRSTSARLKLSDNQKKIDKSIIHNYGLRAKDERRSMWFKNMAKVMFITALLTLSPWLLAVAITSLIIAFTLKPLTQKGLELARYLKGMEMYIKVAEAERLQMLQSPEGAKAKHIDTSNPKELIKLYERMLPYAVLYGYEKQWNKQLGVYYESAGASPSWYAGHNAVFNAAVFSSAMSSFNSIATYSDPSSATSSGSSGGGFSGGGGGGGGGGGW